MYKDNRKIKDKNNKTPISTISNERKGYAKQKYIKYAVKTGG